MSALAFSRTSPERNRVTPAGAIVATPARGTFMGNRGRLSTTAAALDRRPWTTRAWLTCDLAFAGRSRANTGRARYTKLFFLDEAVALAAGHRPCAFCRRPAFTRYREAVRECFGGLPLVPALDARLHGERLDRTSGRQRRVLLPLNGLPDGAFVLDPRTAMPALVVGDWLLPYTPAGYGTPMPRPTNVEAFALTPATSLVALRSGYRPVLHRSNAPA